MSYIYACGSQGHPFATDRWSFKPSAVSLMTAAALALVCQLPGIISFILIPLSLLGYAVASLSILTVALYCVVRKRPRQGASIFFILLAPVLLWLPITWAADLVHLVLTVGFGIGQNGVPLQSDNGKYLVYNWSVGLATSPSMFLIHDVTDEIALPIAQHMHMPIVQKGLEVDCAGRVRGLVYHYYVCTTNP